MPPPFRQPSQVGATAATKRPFKPPAISKGGATSSSSNNTAPTRSAPPQKPAAATSTRPPSWKTNAPGFQSAAHMDNQDLEALLIDDSDDDEDDDDFSAALANAPRSAPVDEPPNKRQKTTAAIPTRLPSLSPMSPSNPPPRATSPHPVPQPAAAVGGPADGIPLLPSALITRLLHEAFDDKNIKIGKDANALTARYLDLFVREAVARANEVAKERKEAREAGGQEDQDVWLEQQDMEEVAPGLVLDF